MRLDDIRFTALLLVLLVVACDSPRKPPPRPYPGYGPPIAPSPWQSPPPPAPAQIQPQPTTTATAPAPAPAPEPVKLSAKARPTLSVSTLQDEAIVVLTILDGEDYLVEHPVGKEKIALADVRFTVKLEGAQSMTRTATGLSGPGVPGTPVELRHEASMALHIGADGVSLLPWMQRAPGSAKTTAKWVDAKGEAPLSKAGEYEVTVSVELPLPSGKQVVSAPPVKMERRVRGRSTTTLAGVEKIARQAAEIHLNKIGRTKDKDQLQPTLLTVDLPENKHHRLARFWMPHGDAWKVLFFEVVVERSGKVVKVNQQERFTCVAAGTRIDTPDGAARVEDLELGDRVWSWDPAAGRRVLSDVVAISEPRRARTLLVDGRLRVTGAHPIWADGEWVRAEDLTTGAELIDGRGSAFELKSVRDDGRSMLVYDVSVTWPHNYFAEGILVHNKRIKMAPARMDALAVLWERATGDFDLTKPQP